MRYPSCHYHPDVNAVDSCYDYSFERKPVCFECHNKYEQESQEVNELLKELERTNTVRQNLYDQKAKLIQEFNNEEIKGNAEITKLFKEIMDGYEEMEKDKSLDCIDMKLMKKEGYTKIKKISEYRKGIVELVYDKYLTIKLLFFKAKVKKGDSIIMWYRCNDEDIIFLNLNDRFDWMKINAPKDIEYKTISGFIGGPSLVKIDTDYYFIGGFSGLVSRNTLFKMSIKDSLKELVKLRSMKFGRYDLAAVHMLKKYLYAISGSVFNVDHEDHSRECEVYDISKDKWKTLHPINIGRDSPGVSTFNDRYIFIYGGQIDGGHRSDTFETYDTLDDERGWAFYKKSELPEGIGTSLNTLMGQASDNQILIIGTDVINLVEINQARMVKAKSFNKTYGNYVFGTSYTYNKKVYWTSENRIYYYDIIRKHIKEKELIFL